MFKLSGKTAVVTGANQGIGKAIAEVFADAGAHVYMCGLDYASGATLADSICARGGKASYRRVDISVESEAKGFVEWAVTETGRVDVLCNNASYTSGAQHDVLNATTEEWNNNFNVGLLGTAYCTKAALPSMINEGGGSIIVISSIQGIAGCACSTPYSTIKAGQIGFVKSAAYDYSPHNVRVNAICPGPIQVDYSPEPGSAAYNTQVGNTILGRVGQPKEIAYAALFLASDEASFITGAVIPIDGGWTAK